MVCTKEMRLAWHTNDALPGKNLSQHCQPGPKSPEGIFGRESGPPAPQEISANPPELLVTRLSEPRASEYLGCRFSTIHAAALQSQFTHLPQLPIKRGADHGRRSGSVRCRDCSAPESFSVFQDARVRPTRCCILWPSMAFAFFKLYPIFRYLRSNVPKSL